MSQGRATPRCTRVCVNDRSLTRWVDKNTEWLSGRWPITRRRFTRRQRRSRKVSPEKFSYCHWPRARILNRKLLSSIVTSVSTTTTTSETANDHWYVTWSGALFGFDFRKSPCRCLFICPSTSLLITIPTHVPKLCLSHDTVKTFTWSTRPVRTRLNVYTVCRLIATAAPPPRIKRGVLLAPYKHNPRSHKSATSTQLYIF